MSTLFKDRVKETSISTGTGNITLDGAAVGFQSFEAAFGHAGNDFYYAIEDGTDWEVGIGHLSAATTLVRASVLASSNSGNAVSFAAGTKHVYCTIPASFIGSALTAQSVQTQGMVSVLGSSGNISFNNGNGVTFGGNASSISASVRTDYQSSGDYLTTGMRSDAATISNIKMSGGTQSALRSDLTFADSNGISFGLDNGVFTATVKTDYQSSGNYLTTAALSQDSSKYAGTNGAITGGSLTLNTSGISINLPAYLTTAMQSNAATISNINVSGGTTQSNLSNIKFIDSNGVSWSLDTGSKIYATVKTDYLTTAALSGDTSKYNQNWKLTGNTSGTTSSAQGTDIWFKGGNNITISGSSNSIVISGANAGGVQTGISGIIVSDATYTSGTVSFSNAGNITISSSVNGATQYIKLSGNAAQTNQSAIKGLGVSNTGQTAGNTGLSTGIDWVLAGSQSITLSQSTAVGGPNTIWFQHPAWLTTAALSQDSSKYAGTNGAITGGSITVNTSGVSINLPAYLTTADLSANSSKYVQNWKLTGNTSGTTSSAQGTDLWLSGGSNITVSGSSNSIVFSVGPYITTADLSQNSSKYAGTNGAITGGSLTVNTSGISINLPAYLTTAMQSGAATISNINVSGGTTQSNLSAIKFIDSNGVSWSLDTGSKVYATVKTDYQSSGNYLTTADLSQNSSKYIQNWKLTGNTLGTTSSAQGTDFWLSGGANITLSGSSNSIIISGASAAPSPVNVSAGTTASNLASIVFSNSNQVSFGLNGATITGSIPGTSSLSATGAVSISVNGSTISIGAATQTNQNISFYAQSNTTNNSSSVINASSLQIQGAGNISVGLSNGSVQVSGKYPDLQYFELDDVQGMGLLTNITAINTRPIFVPFILKGNLTNNSMILQMSRSTSGSNAFTVQAAIYSYGNSTSIARVGSLQNAFSASNTASVSGVRYFALTGWENAVTALSPGAYVMGLNFSANGGNTLSMNYSIFGGQTASNPVGVVSAGSDQNNTTATNWGVANFWGRYTANSAAFPANIGQTDIIANISGASTPLAPWFILRP